eukprot:8499978-Pyramimonas_sp.AAC.1
MRARKVNAQLASGPSRRIETVMGPHAPGCQSALPALLHEPRMALRPVACQIRDTDCGRNRAKHQRPASLLAKPPPQTPELLRSLLIK